MEDSEKKEYKVVFLGSSGVGKTSIIVRETQNAYDEFHENTIVDNINYTAYIDGSPVKINLWDTAGQEKYRNIVPLYYRGSSVACLVFSLAERSTFDDLDGWMKDIVNSTEAKPSLILVGGKKDLTRQIEVESEEAEEYAQKIGAKYIDTSAKTGENISELFSLIASLAITKNTSELNSVQIEVCGPTKNEDKCC
ncbi:GTP-binding protein YPT6 [Tritrichomonas foetus]|uniref:GTP-binding protein YPT6 n=1 Tax=Tritrichomonas foetus TaxID=1144522 RepID=A0A1J4JCJ3_9EUKA|nr:GTP-binding protein YPT6 [Tritrichomonas foetus]|eukprot:OHS95379.1 GTP-binding protein YPT6 [Tritrichomonas foetus]